MEAAVKKLNVKFELLNIVVKEIPRVTNKNKIGDSEKLLQTIEEKTQDLRTYKLQVQEIKLEAGEDGAAVFEWGNEFENKLDKALEAVEELTNAITRMKGRETREEENQEAQEREKQRKRRFEEERELEELRIKLRNQDFSMKKSDTAEPRDRDINARLPKLTITPFKGTLLDWQRFWNQFTTEIDKKNMPCVTKFSYLRELVDGNVQPLINGLPFTTEGYARAKSILSSKYGRSSEVANAHIQEILALPTVYLHRNISSQDVKTIHDFYEKLLTHVQALDTMGKLNEIKGYVRMTLDKLPDIRADLVRTSEDWQDWNFEQLLKALTQWTERNPLQSNQSPVKRKTTPLLQTNKNSYCCVYCESPTHKSFECESVDTVGERKRILSTKRLCFNCTRPYHHANECRSNNKCKHCQKRHHSSICESKGKQTTEYRRKTIQTEQTMMTNEETRVVYPVVVVYVNGVKCRALLDTGAGSSYASSFLLDILNTQPIRKETKTIEMMMSSTNAKIEIFNVTIENLKKTFALQTEVNKVNRKVLINLPNPNYDTMKERYNHLRQVELNDNDTKPELPIHLILGASEYARIKTDNRPKIGKQGDPVAEFTRFGWTIMCPGREADITGTMLTQSTLHNYDRLCSLDVLGLQDMDNDREIYDEFKSQLTRHPDGFYETGLIWKIGHPPLPSNENGSIGRFNNLVRKLQSDQKTFKAYDDVIQSQLEEGIIEPVVNEEANKIYYIPHKPVVRENAESTKLRVVYDASAAINGVSLNSCLEPGPSLQNLLWSVILRERLQPIALCADLKQAFLQIRIKEEDRDVLRFHWMKDRDPKQRAVYRFTRALFGLNQSPFLLQGTINHHLEESNICDKRTVEKIKRDTYVDDIISGDETMSECRKLKENLINLFGDATFTLHKWHSNVAEYEMQADESPQEVTTYAKQQLENQYEEHQAVTTILGLRWNKRQDQLSVEFPKPTTEVTKRAMLQKLASIYDPLGITGPITLRGKLLFRESCDLKLAWDQPVTDDLYKRWINWEKSLPTQVSFPRAFDMSYATIESIDIHTFADASCQGVCATLYVIINQLNGETHQGILTAKCRLAKKELTIPRLELVAAHMASNITANTVDSLKSTKVRKIICWSDSTVVLHWLKSGREYKAFVTNRVRKIKENHLIKWRHVPTDQNPADTGSRGNKLLEPSWLKGPAWLNHERDWPKNIVTEESEVSNEEARKLKTVLAATMSIPNAVLKLLEKHSLWKFLRITTWIRRFIINLRGHKKSGPLTTDEIEQQMDHWVKSTQEQHVNDPDFNSDQERLNLRKNDAGVYECHGRITGEFPIYLPTKSLLAEKLITDAHLQTLHGGVSLTMAKIREKWWIPRLRSIVKTLIQRCNGCMRFRAVAFPTPPPGKLPRERTTATTKPFKVIGVDYAGPFTITRQQKAYILLFACSVSRAIHLELLPNQTTEQFVKALKRLIARRGLPSIIYSDNAKTFQAGSKWLKRILHSNDLHNFSAVQSFKWRFNLSRAPWWGGQFERLIGIVKQSLYKSVGISSLTFNEFEDILLDIETTQNNRPLGYVEDDVQQPTLTPNKIIHGEDVLLPEEDTEVLDESLLCKRLKYLQRCKNEAWKRWRDEYMRSLRERHNMKHKTQSLTPNVGDVVLIKGDAKNRGQWSIGVVKELMIGQDNVLRAVRVRSGAYDLERAVQHLYPLELHCDVYENSKSSSAEVNSSDTEEQRTLNAKANEFRPRRNAAVIAGVRNKDLHEYETCEPTIE